MIPGAHNHDDDRPPSLTLWLLLALTSWAIIFTLARFFYLLTR